MSQNAPIPQQHQATHQQSSQPQPFTPRTSLQQQQQQQSQQSSSSTQQRSPHNAQNASPAHRQSSGTGSGSNYNFDSSSPTGSVYPKQQQHHHGDSRDMNGIAHAAHLHNFPCNAEGYDVLAEIGVGAFATVYRAVVKGSGEEVAIKVMDLEQFNTNWDEIRREILTMSLLHHNNVVRILTSFVDGQDLWIVMPLLKAGSCAALMKILSPSGFKDEVLVATILREALKGLEYLHKDGRIHRDVKAGNILVGEHGEIQLGDFGVAAALLENGDRQRNRQTFTGTPCWMAPEVMEHTTGYDEKADIWSFGITAMELGFGRAPYAKFQPMKVMLLTLQEDPPTADIYKDDSYKFTKNFHSMISKCLRKDPKKRPSAKKLLEHKFFKLAEDNSYVYSHLVRRIPENKLNGTDLSASQRPHVCREKTIIDAAKTEKSKPVSVGSWIFDKDDFEEFKKHNSQQIAEEAKQHRKYTQSGGSDSEKEDEQLKAELKHHPSQQIQNKVKDVERRRQQEQQQLIDPERAKQVQHETPGIASSCRTGRFTVTDDDGHGDSEQQLQHDAELEEAQRNRPIPQFDQPGPSRAPASLQPQNAKKKESAASQSDDVKSMESQVGRFSVRDD